MHRVAYLASATNALAAAAMLALLRPGLLGDQAWIATHKPLWIFGWLLWQLAAISLVAFYAALSIRFRERGPIRCTTALVVAGAGLAADLAAETYLMIRPDALRLLAPLTGYLGNGGYTVAGALLLWAGARGLPRWLILLGAATFAAGVALSAATLAQSQAAETVTTAALMPLFVLWSFAMGRWLRAS